MNRLPSVLATLVGTLALAACDASQADAQAPAQPPLPSGLVLDTPEMPLGIEGAMLALNQSLSEGLDPADNAAVLLVQVFGPDTFEAELRIASLDMLGIRSLAKSPRFQYVEAYVRDGAANAEEAAGKADELARALLQGGQQLWTREELPNLAAYLDANAEALDLVVAAGDRPRYYAPLLSMETPMRLMSASFSVEHRMTFMARCLSARALLRFSEGNLPAATADLVACHKLAALLAGGSPLDISCAKAHIVDAQAALAELAIVRSGRLQDDQAASLLAAISAAPTIPTSEDAANRGERAILHEELELLRSDAESRNGFLETGTPDDLQELEKLVASDEHWGAIMAAADATHDKMVQALAIRPRPEQFEAFAALDAEYATWSAAADEEGVPFAELVKKDPAAAARSIGESMAMAVRTNAWQRRHSDDRARMRRDSALLSLALIAYRSRHESFPAALSDLAPEILPAVPNDPFSEKEFEYRRIADDHVMLVSLGANQVNDDGSIFNDDMYLEVR